MNLTKIFSITNEYHNTTKIKVINILGYVIKFKVFKIWNNTSRPYKYKLNSKYLKTKGIVNKFDFDENKNDLYNYFLNSTDKNINKMHHFFHIYDKHFNRYRGKQVNILEIGVCRGGSLKMWKNYFGEKATIYGVDIDSECKKYEDLDQNIHVYIADQCNRNDLRKLMNELPTIDIIIDDGGHTTTQQITTFEECYDKI